MNALPRGYIISGYDICNTNRLTLVLNRSRAYAGVLAVHGVSCSAIYFCDNPMPDTFYPQRPALYRRINRRHQKQRLLPIGRSKRQRDALSLCSLLQNKIVCVCGISHREGVVGKRNLTSNVDRRYHCDRCNRPHLQHDWHGSNRKADGKENIRKNK